MQELANQARQIFGVKLTHAQLNALQRYEAELLAWNERFNLTAIHSPEDIRVKHFLDSLSCLCAMRGTAMERLIDVGTGAGFPGLVLKIAVPAIRLTLVESVGKKARFCEHVVDTLKLDGVQVVANRAETVGHMDEHRQAYDWAVARAVAVLPVLAEYLLPLVRIGGYMLAMKGESAHQEVQTAESALRLLGGRLVKILPVTLPGVVEARHLVVIEKIAATPSGYPRRVGVPVKKAL